MRNRIYQPTTLDTKDLLIGLNKVYVGGASLGAVQSATFSLTPKTISRVVGYPAGVEQLFLDDLDAAFAIEVEELGSVSVQDLLTDLAYIITHETVMTYEVEAIAEFARGGTLGIKSTKAQLMPSFELDMQDDWNSLRLLFKPTAGEDGTTPLAVITRTNGTVRDRGNQPMTKHPKNLSIGRFRVEFNGSSVGAIQAARLVVSSSTKELRLGYPKQLVAAYTVATEISILLESEETHEDWFDVLLDSINGASKVNVNLISNLATGNILTLNIPSCQYVPEASLNSRDDWMATRFKLVQANADGLPVFNASVTEL